MRPCGDDARVANRHLPNTMTSPDESETAAQRVFHVEDRAYGARGDGRTDDTRAFMAAARALAAAGGGTLTGRAGATYVLFPDSWQRGGVPRTPIASFAGLSGVTIDFAQATLRVPRTVPFTTAGANVFHLFRFQDCSGVTCRANVVGHDHMGISVLCGVVPFQFNGACRNVTVSGRFTGVYIPAAFVSGPYPGGTGTRDPARRTIGVSLDLQVTHSGYGSNFRFSGDSARVRLTTEGVYRSYFPYGVRDHEAWVTSRDALAADCLLKAYEGYGLENIRLHYTNRDTTSAISRQSAAAAIEIAWGDTIPAVFRDLWIDVDVRYRSANAFGPVLRVVRHAGEPLDTSTRRRGHQLRGLRLGGVIQGVGAAQSPVINLDFGGSRTYLEAWSGIHFEELRATGVPDNLLELRGSTGVVRFRRVSTSGRLTVLVAPERGGSVHREEVEEVGLPVGSDDGMA
jgi:hypothetical protein